MAKERVLTVMVPVTNNDAKGVAQSLMVLAERWPPSAERADEIYYVVSESKFYRPVKDAATGNYEYKEVEEREFPYIGQPMEIKNFTYDAERMGKAPSITAQGVMWYATKDENGLDETLEGLWSQNVFVRFNGEKFYLKQIPTASLSNEDARYKYDLDFVSERVVLENVYLYDVVTPFVSEKPISESAKFSFFGDVAELAKRINASLLRSGLASIVYKPYVTADSYLTYEEFNAVGLGTYTGDKDTADPFPIVRDNGAYIHYTHDNIYEHFGGDYNKYLLNMVYEVKNPKVTHIGPVNGGYNEIYDGEFTITGYQCKIGKDAEGNDITSEEKLISFDNSKIHEALQHIHDTFELQYYISKEKDSAGDFTGNTIIWVADCEYDFADRKKGILVRGDDGLPTTTDPLDYGADDAFLSKEKANTTEAIVTRITGVGSSENIPWYYPNPTADGWIRPVYKRGGVVQSVEIEYPKSEGETTQDSVLYEKYLNNRLGDVISWGIRKNVIKATDYKETLSGMGVYTDDPTKRFISLYYVINTKEGYTDPKATINFSLLDGSHGGRVYASLRDNTNNALVSEYDSALTYSSPTAFQSAFTKRDGSVILNLEASHVYYLYISIDLDTTPILSKRHDFSGYYYPGRVVGLTAEYNQYYDIPSGQTLVRIREDFYNEPNLVEVGELFKFYYINHIPTIDIGYSVDGTPQSAADPLPRVPGKSYLDINSGTIYRTIDGGPQAGEFFANPEMTFDEWVSEYMRLSVSMYNADGWYKKSKKIALSDIGITNERALSEAADVATTIEFQRVKYVTPQPNLMPELYIKTDGERRFYTAHNYYNGRLRGGTLDDKIGEEYADERRRTIRNPLYKVSEDDADDAHYSFENEYVSFAPYEHIENFDDVKPSIKGQMNSDGKKTFRIDVVEEFAYDEFDSDEVWESNDGGNVSGEYKHPYFFAKLRPLGFNLFDLALQDDMVLSMTTGHCGACNFKIAVDENTMRNPVQIWEYDVYQGSNWNNKVKVYSAGDLRRYVDTSNLYYDTDGTAEGYRLVGLSTSVRTGFIVSDASITSGRVAAFERTTYSAERVLAGEVGALKQDGKNHFPGDVMTNGHFIASQQDTSENYVWVALMKDTESYGTIMPAARPDYGDDNLSTYIEPKGHYFTDRSTGETVELSDDEADKFVLTNIRLPQAYLRSAERLLSRKLIAYMYDNNYQKYNFSVDFSRIFLAEDADYEANLTEASVLYIRFNKKIYRQYVKHYSYRVTENEPLPEIKVDTNEELNVTRTTIEQQNRFRQQLVEESRTATKSITAKSELKLNRRTIGRNEDVIIGGNMIIRDGSMSLGELGQADRKREREVGSLQVDLATNHYKRSDFKILNGTDLVIGDDLALATPFLDGTELKRRAYGLDSTRTLTPTETSEFEPLNTFNTQVADFNAKVAGRINQIKYTIEKRISGGETDTCDGAKMFTTAVTNTFAELWLTKDGEEQTFVKSGICPVKPSATSSAGDNMSTTLTWTSSFSTPVKEL